MNHSIILFLFLFLERLLFFVETCCKYCKTDEKSNIEFKEDEVQRSEREKDLESLRLNQPFSMKSSPNFSFNRRISASAEEVNFFNNSLNHRELLSGFFNSQIEDEIAEIEERLREAMLKLNSYKQNRLSKMEDVMKTKIEIMSLQSDLKMLKSKKDEFLK